MALMAGTGPGQADAAGVLVVLPAGCILIGQCLRLYSDRSAEARHARIWRYVRWAHLLLCLIVSIGMPAAMYFQTDLIARGVLPRPIVAEMPWYFWLGLSVSLLLITGMSIRYAIKHYPGKSAICWSVWSVVLMTVMLIPLSKGPLMNPTAAAKLAPPQDVTIPPKS
ncbi:MAG: hypothetical protein Kow00105_18930 [Phycisphaeraceae bacterium]